MSCQRRYVIGAQLAEVDRDCRRLATGAGVIVLWSLSTPDERRQPTGRYQRCAGHDDSVSECKCRAQRRSGVAETVGGFERDHPGLLSRLGQRTMADAWTTRFSGSRRDSLTVSCLRTGSAVYCLFEDWPSLHRALICQILDAMRRRSGASIIPASTNYAASGMILSGTFILFTPISSSDRVAPSLAPHGASDTLTSRGW